MRALILFAFAIMLCAAQQADFIIVGAGSAGSVIAKRLSDAGFSILVFEAGPSDAERNDVITTPAGSVWGTDDMDWSFKTVARSGLLTVDGDNRTDVWPRGKTWGGSSSINAMLYVRGQVSDWDKWVSATGDDAWSYSNVLKRYISQEGNTIPNLADNKDHGTAGPLRVSSAVDPYLACNISAHAYANLLQLPQNGDYNSEQGQLGATYSQLTQLKGGRWSASDAFLKPSLAMRGSQGHALVSVKSQCQVTRVLFNSSIVTGVEYVCGGSANKPQAANCNYEVILSAGAIQSPHLALLSGIGPSEQLSRLNIPIIANLSGVGENLQDHLIFPVTLAVNVSNAQTDPRPTNSVSHLVFHKSDPSLPTADIQVSIQGEQWDGSIPIPVSGSITLGPCLNHPRSVGSLSLSSVDPFAQPLISPNYLSDPADLAAMVSALSLAQKAAATPPLANIVTGTPNFGAQFPWGNASSVAERQMYIRRKAHTSYHPCCTMAMGMSSDPNAVVNTHGQVFNVRGLRVADASIMPKIMSGNLNAPTIMLAQKIADDIIADYRPTQVNS